MSWHHKDFISLVSSCSGVISTLLALSTTVKAFRFQKETREREDSRRGEEARNDRIKNLENRVMMLFDRANNCVDSDAKIKANVESLQEMTSSINSACEILYLANITDDERKKIRFWSDNLLRPGIRHELKTQEVLKLIDGEKISGLEESYRQARRHLLIM